MVTTIKERTAPAKPGAKQKGKRQSLESWIYLANVAVAEVVALSLPYHVSRPITDIFHWVWTSKREGARRNYARMLGTSPDDERVKRLTLSCFHNFGKYIVDMFHVQGWSESRLDRVERHGEEPFDEG